MTRKSRRELEDALASMDDGDADAAVGGAAPFVSYGEDADLVDAPDGWTVSTTTIGDATFRVVERTDDGEAAS